MTDDNDESDEPAALLTQAQREYLRGEKDYRPSVERQVRTRIRRRVRTALETDIPLLTDEFSSADIVGELDPNVAVPLRETVAFAALLAAEATLKDEQIVKDGLEQARSTRAQVTLQRLKENPDDVTMGEISNLREMEEIGRDEYEDLLSDVLRRPEPGNTSLPVDDLDDDLDGG